MKRRIFAVVCFMMTIAVVTMMTIQNIFPQKYADLIRRSSEKYDLDESLVYAVIHTESRFDALAQSHRGAKGLMQLMDSTAFWGAEELGYQNFTEDKIYVPEYNIDIGCWYLRKLLNQFDGDYTLVLAAYNGGSGNVRNWLSDENVSKDGENLDIIPFKETERYVQKVYNTQKIYRYLYLK